MLRYSVVWLWYFFLIQIGHLSTFQIKILLRSEWSNGATILVFPVSSPPELPSVFFLPLRSPPVSGKHEIECLEGNWPQLSQTYPVRVAFRPRFQWEDVILDILISYARGVKMDYSNFVRLDILYGGSGLFFLSNWYHTIRTLDHGCSLGKPLLHKDAVQRKHLEVNKNIYNIQILYYIQITMLY